MHTPLQEMGLCQTAPDSHQDRAHQRVFPKQQRQHCPTKDLYDSTDALKGIICRDPGARHRATLALLLV